MSDHQFVIIILFQEELIPGVSKDQEALLISLKRPIVFIQPAAFDKGSTTFFRCCITLL